MKLGGNVLLAMPDLFSSSLLQSATRGPRYLVQKVQNWPFWPFLMDLKVTKGGMRRPEAVADSYKHFVSCVG